MEERLLRDREREPGSVRAVLDQLHFDLIHDDDFKYVGLSGDGEKSGVQERYNPTDVVNVDRIRVRTGHAHRGLLRVPIHRGGKQHEVYRAGLFIRLLACSLPHHVAVLYDPCSRRRMGCSGPRVCVLRCVPSPEPVRKDQSRRRVHGGDRQREDRGREEDNRHHGRQLVRPASRVLTLAQVYVL